MPKMFKMYGELFMEVTPQPWLIKASKTVKTKLADDKRFCVNMNTGALTAYDPANIREEPIEKAVPKFKVTLRDHSTFDLASDFETAKEQLTNLGVAHGLLHCVVASNQPVTPVGYPISWQPATFFEKVRSLYQLSHIKAKA